MLHVFDTHGGTHWSTEQVFPCARDFMLYVLQVEVNLSHTDISRTVQQWDTPLQSLHNLDWSGQDLTSCHVMHVNFQGGIFNRTIMRDILATHANFQSCDFSGAILDAGSFEWCDFSRSEFDVVPQVGEKTRHPLRPQRDEFLPFDRVLARSTNFAHAQFTQCVFVHVMFPAAQFEHADFTNSIFEHCDFEGALFEDTCMVGCMVFNCELVTTTLCRCKTTGACFRGNEYFEMPMPKVITLAAWKFPQQLSTYVQEEYSHWQRMGTEVKQDYKRQVIIKLVIMLSVPIMVLLAWKYVETNWVVSMVTAVGAMSTWAMRRYVTMILQATGGWLLGRVSHAEGLWRLGHRRAAILSLMSTSKVTEEFRSKHKQP